MMGQTVIERPTKVLLYSITINGCNETFHIEATIDFKVDASFPLMKNLEANSEIVACRDGSKCTRTQMYSYS